jgi:hypothetical protein
MEDLTNCEDTDSEDQNLCLICLDEIENQYATINSEGEVGKYHLTCLQTWFTKNPYGIISRVPVETYTIFENDLEPQVVNVNKLIIFWENFKDLAYMMWYGRSLDEDDDEQLETEDCITDITDMFCWCMP